MTPIARTTQALLATALIVTPVTAIAQNSVQKQVNAVADKAEELSDATNTLNNKVAAEQRNNDAAAAAATDGDRGRDGDRDGDRDRGHDRDGDDDDGGKWGLLGLLGLAGLLGLRRNDQHHDHRRDRADIDNRTGTRDTDATRR